MMAMDVDSNKKAGWFGPVLVATTACILTVTILGSIGILGWRFYERRQLQQRVRDVVSSLQNRKPEELAEKAEQLKERPKVARYVLPQIREAIVRAPSEQQQWSAIRIAEAFIHERSVEKSLFRLRKSPKERVAAEATRILSLVQPPTRAAERLGACLVDAQCGAVRDEACAGLVRLGEVGRLQMEKPSARAKRGAAPVACPICKRERRKQTGSRGSKCFPRMKIVLFRAAAAIARAADLKSATRGDATRRSASTSG